MFQIVLNFVALYGAIKEECYLILTYNLFISSIYVVSFIYKWRPLIELLSFGLYIAFSFFFSYLIYLRHPVLAS